MKKIIRLTESDLHRMVLETVHKLLNESIGGKYQVYVDGEPRNVLIDPREPSIRIDDYVIGGIEAQEGIKQILGFLHHGNGDIESAIEQYLYNSLR